MTFGELLEEENKEVAAALAEHIDVIIVRYANKHAINQVQIGDPEASPKDSVDKYNFIHSNTLGGKVSALDFSTATKEKASKHLGFKKSTTI